MGCGVVSRISLMVLAIRECDEGIEGKKEASVASRNSEEVPVCGLKRNWLTRSCVARELTLGEGYLVGWSLHLRGFLLGNT